MKFIYLSVLLVFLLACNQTGSDTKSEAHNKSSNKNFSTITVNNEQMNYPITQKGNVEDTYFGTTIKDPYRWLEDDRSEETAEWVTNQNAITDNYLSNIQFRNDVRNRLEQLYDYEKISSPFQEGDYTYYYKNDGLQNQSILFRKNADGKEELFLNPNTFSKDGTTSLAGVSFSKDGSRAAYQISEGGSDWRKVVIINTNTMKQICDTLLNVKFSGLAWKGNDTLYYSSYDKPKGSELSAKTDQHKLYRHKVGQPQSTDEVIFGNKADEKHRYVGAYLTEDERFLIISASVSTSGNKLFIKDLTKPNSELLTIINHTHSDTTIIGNDGEILLLQTNLDAPNNKVVKTLATAPGSEHWEVVIPESDNVLNASTAGKQIFVETMVDALTQIKQYDYNGELIREIELPGLGTAGGFRGKETDDELYFSFTNYNTPRSIYKYNIQTGKYSNYWSPSIDVDFDMFESKQVFYTSKDGTKVPMMLTYKKGIELNGNNPTILYGYGGFNISLQPSYNSLLPVWLEQGGVYAVPNLRGGGEYGKKWHDAGTQLNKQNVFDDFIAAAEYLIEKKYTSSDKLAISGRSNGGLLVGATMTQRPDLMKVALPGVGVLDMLRYHTFTAGAGWAYDYGTAEQSEEMFQYLKAYSPVHNVVQGKHYPATMVYTADHDDRVVPAHSFKFISELQAKQSGTNPVLIRIETNSGHGAGKPTSKLLDEWADLYSFTMYNLGVQPNY